MRHALYAAVLLILVTSATTVLACPPPPSVSYTEATIPASLLGPETELACLTAVQPEEVAEWQPWPTVTASLVCYDWGGQALHLKNATGSNPPGVLLLPIWGCEEIVPGFAVSLMMVVNLSSGTGSTILVQDFTPPLDCRGTALYGALTMTELPQNHDEDGDGCTDWKELLSGWDPFNPGDC